MTHSLHDIMGTPGDRQNMSPYPEFELTGVICIGKDLKGTEIVFVLTRLYCKHINRNKQVSSI